MMAQLSVSTTPAPQHACAAVRRRSAVLWKCTTVQIGVCTIVTLLSHGYQARQSPRLRPATKPADRNSAMALVHARRCAYTAWQYAIGSHYNLRNRTRPLLSLNCVNVYPMEDF